MYFILDRATIDNSFLLLQSEQRCFHAKYQSVYDLLGGRAKLKKYLFLMPMASLGKKKFL